LYASPVGDGRIPACGEDRAIRSNKNAGLGKGGVWGFAPNSKNKNAEAFLFRSYPLRVSRGGIFPPVCNGKPVV
jgi:hypothetical protein